MATRVVDRNNLSAIGTAIRAYSMEHNDEMPRDLNDLWGKYITGDKVFESRSSGEKVQFLRDERPSLALFYSSSDEPVAALHGKNGGNVLYRDGSVRWLDDKEFNKQIAPKLAERRSDEARALGGNAGQGVAISQPTSHTFAGGRSFKNGDREFRVVNVSGLVDANAGYPQPSVKPSAPAPAAATAPAKKTETIPVIGNLFGNRKAGNLSVASQEAPPSVPEVSSLAPSDKSKMTTRTFDVMPPFVDKVSTVGGESGVAQPRVQDIGEDQAPVVEKDESGAEVPLQPSVSEICGGVPETPPSGSGGRQSSAAAQTPAANPQNEATNVKVVGYGQPDFDTPAAPTEEKPAKPLRVICLGADTVADDEKPARGSLCVLDIGSNTSTPDWEDDTPKSPAAEKNASETSVRGERESNQGKNITADYAHKQLNGAKNLEGGASAPPWREGITNQSQLSAVGSSGKPSGGNVPEDSIVVRTYDWSPDLSEKLVMMVANGVTDYTKHSDWKGFFADLGVQWPEGSKISIFPLSARSLWRILRTTFCNLKNS